MNPKQEAAWESWERRALEVTRRVDRASNDAITHAMNWSHGMLAADAKNIIALGEELANLAAEPDQTPDDVADQKREAMA